MQAGRNIYEQQDHNRRVTWLVMAVFIAFAAFLGWGFDAFVLGNDAVRASEPGEPAPIRIPIGTIAAGLIGSGMATFSFFFGASAVLKSTGAYQVYPEIQDENLRRLHNVVDEMSIASGLPKPRVYLLPDDDLNAFATGRDPQHACLAVTRGLVNTLSRDELQAVVAHEMSHIRNYDVRLMTVVAALVGTIALLSDWAMRSRLGRTSNRGRDKDSGGANIVVFVIWIVAVILAPFLSQLAAMAVSRRREYLADASAGELTRNPMALASALKKIDDAVQPTQGISRGSAHLCIADPLERRVTNSEGWLADVFATHPPMARRIEALQNMAYQYQTQAH